MWAPRQCGGWCHWLNWPEPGLSSASHLWCLQPPPLATAHLISPILATTTTHVLLDINTIYIFQISTVKPWRFLWAQVRIAVDYGGLVEFQLGDRRKDRHTLIWFVISYLLYFSQLWIWTLIFVSLSRYNATFFTNRTKLIVEGYICFPILCA